MKRVISFFIVAILLVSLCGCASYQSGEGTVYQETTILNTDKYEYEPGIVRVSNTLALAGYLNRGDRVIVAEEYGNYVHIIVDYVDYFTEKQYIRLDSEHFDQYVGYATKDIEIFEKDDMQVSIMKIKKGDTVNVIDGYGTYLIVSVNDTEGYTYSANISKEKPSESKRNTTKIPETNSSASSTPSTGADGQDIQLAFHIGSSRAIRLDSNASTDSCEGTVLKNQLPYYIWEYNRNDKICIIERGEEYSTVLVNGRECFVKTNRIQKMDEKTYEEWTGYATENTPVFIDYSLNQTLARMNKNDEVQVVDEVDGVYVVTIDGVEGYILASKISSEKSKTKKPASNDTAIGGTSQEWTEPAL